ncbi:putative RDD family membrane protein YckC [Novosphingobium kunmingense]|uniref:Putative RDD family membrane protein YckC n=1 Tax=Novosphingobium kunmingense TaxID=1211806 RepID=A0A2N0HJU7_9SPHN|nr:RDD family protein [Novosphingobium kunmingense]PKB19145.1 putative RDD family membrane protein YckC [Novosphingobium kunmingense]
MNGIATHAANGRSRRLVTPEGLALPIIIASRATRFGALVIDLVIMTLGILVVSGTLLMLGIQLFGGKGGGGGRQLGEVVAIAWLIAVWLTRYAYFLFFELGPRGATPGKRLTGIRIAARSGGRLTAEMVLARNLLRDIEIFLPLQLMIGTIGDDGTDITGMAAGAWFLLFALFPLFNRDRLRAGDLIAGTWVVEAPRHRLEALLSASLTARLGASAATGAQYRFSEADLAIYGEFELQTLERVLREDRPEALAAVQDAICRKLGWNPGAGDERAFLEAYYTQLRARLETGMRMGRRKADKNAGTA